MAKINFNAQNSSWTDSMKVFAQETIEKGMRSLLKYTTQAGVLQVNFRQISTILGKKVRCSITPDFVEFLGFIL